MMITTNRREQQANCTMYCVHLLPAGRRYVQGYKSVNSFVMPQLDASFSFCKPPQFVM